MNIQVPKGDPVFDPTDTGEVNLPFQRGVWDKDSSQSPNNPRTQVAYCYTSAQVSLSESIRTLTESLLYPHHVPYR